MQERQVYTDADITRNHANWIATEPSLTTFRIASDHVILLSC